MMTDCHCLDKNHRVSFMGLPKMPHYRGRTHADTMPTKSILMAAAVSLCLLLAVEFSNALDTSNDIDALLLDTLSSTTEHSESDISSFSRIANGDGDHQVRKQWGLPDTTAHVGQLFRYHIPADAFTGNIHHYEASSASSDALPSWLQFNVTTSTLEGVPTSRDIGQSYLIIKAHGDPEIGKSNSAQDIFSLDVLSYDRNVKPSFLLKDSDRSSPACDSSQGSASMSIVLDADIHSLTPLERIQLMTKLLAHLRIPDNLLHLLPYEYSDKILNSNTVMAGPGNAREKLTSGLIANWQLECNPWTGLDAPDSQVTAVEQSSRDGSLAIMLGVPIVGWHISVIHPQVSTGAHRQRRQIPFGLIPTPVPGVVPTKHRQHPNYDESAIHEIYPEREETETAQIDEDEGPIPDVRIVPTMASPTFTLATTLATHRHRHHHELGTYPRGNHYHGRQLLPEEAKFTATPSLGYFRGTLAVLSTPSPTPALPPIDPTRPTERLEITNTSPIVVLPPDYRHSESVSPTETTKIAHTFPSHPSTEQQGIIPSSTTDVPVTTETVSSGATMHNFRPVIINRIQKIPFIAGKIYYYRVPPNTFHDLEQGDTTKLKLIFMNSDGTALHPSAWLKFDEEQQAIRAIPLEHNIGTWNFILEAVDNEGKSVQEAVEIHVQQHPSSRAVHHEFVMYLKYDSWRFASQIDWQVKLADKLSQFFGDLDASNILVRSITTEPSVIFTWTNDSLLAQPCPQDMIMDLMHEMATRDGSQTKYLRKIMTPEFRVQKLIVNFLGNCKSKVSPTTPTHTNIKPEVPNQIDEIVATVGEFLSYKVPEDTFNDEEDGDTRHLHLTFLTIDGIELPRTYWLKFNRQQQVFIGLPMDEDVGRREYQLVATDKNGSSVVDALEVIVRPRPADRHPSVEFSIVIDTDFNAFNSDIFKKVMVLDKLAHVFGDPDPRFITVHSITRGSVFYAWSNNSLPYDPCPKEMILQLAAIMFNENGTVSERTLKTFSPDFNVTSANMMPLGICMSDIPLMADIPRFNVTPTAIIPGRTTTVVTGTATVETGTATSEDDIYMTTIIPAIVIVIMLLVAAIIACALYRKRRKGKMTMDSDNGNFVNKGIPIIFADELVDKPDPAKSPVILKEEKPPLPPPEYPRSSSGSASPSTPPHQAPDRPPSSRRPMLAMDPSRHPPAVHRHPRGGGSVPGAGRNEDDHLLGPDPAENTPPYQPPPPFTANRESRLSRPKHTPTYRLPPPYVPP